MSIVKMILDGSKKTFLLHPVGVFYHETYEARGDITRVHRYSPKRALSAEEPER